MKNKLAKMVSSFAMAAVLSCTGLSAFAADSIDADEVYGITIEEYANWGIDDFVESIKTPYKLTYPDQAEIVDVIVDAIASNEDFIEMFNEKGESAFQIIEDSLHDALTPSASLSVSVYDNTRYISSLEAMKERYPHGSYYSTTGAPCTCHASCDWNSGSWCTCMKYKYKGMNYSSQCAAFAMEIFEIVKGRNYYDSNGTRTKRFDRSIDESTAKSCLQSLSNGTYLRLKTKYKTVHSIAILGTSSTGIDIADANMDGRCGVRWKHFTWADFAKEFPYLYFYVD